LVQRAGYKSQRRYDSQDVDGPLRVTNREYAHSVAAPLFSSHEEDKEIRLSVLVKETDCSAACRDIPQLIYCCFLLFTPILYASVNTKSF